MTTQAKGPRPKTLAGRRVVVMGLGRFGGGIGVTRFLARQGAGVLVTDRAKQDELAESLAAIADCGAELRLGEHRESDFTSADLVVASPAVPLHTDPYLQAARQAGVPITSEIRLLVERLPDPRKVIGVTGSAGKSTTTAMIGHVLVAVFGAQNVHVGGNLGGSLLERVETIRPDDLVVLELSSFMLEHLAPARWSPGVAVVTNITPNHLDWHGCFEAYAAAKQVILEHQLPQDAAVLGPGLQAMRVPAGLVVRVEAPPDPPLPLLLPGWHNQLNAAVALAAVGILGVDRVAAAKALAEFAGLPHRMQMAVEHQGVRYYNDSKATTPEATMLALESFEPGIAHLILGGYDKGSDFTALAHKAATHAQAVYTIGLTGSKIADLVEKAGGTVVRCGNLENAVTQIVGRVHRGDVVLLSTASASWDQFTHYEQRGAAFIELVLRCTGEGSPIPKEKPRP
ncbi:MAG: UDP-N-acetylmuramoyl-L-alanine--D-glutamate ligase [Phycisphaeraceae bacterium]|nr:UDP-N-acetylmuramoyl-L-alanine--D-glutamate ligase [Phycisphaeraceae bacterium]